MQEQPVKLDATRSNYDLLATTTRRRLRKNYQASVEKSRQRNAAFEAQLLAGPAETWRDAAIRMAYLIQLYAETAEGGYSPTKRLVDRALDDFERLSRSEEDGS